MPNGPANDHFTRGGISLSSAPAAVPSTARAPAKASAQIFPLPLIAPPPGPAVSSFGRRRAARHRRAGYLARHCFADGRRQRLRFLDQAEQRQNDEEVRSEEH